MKQPKQLKRCTVCDKGLHSKNKSMLCVTHYKQKYNREVYKKKEKK